MEISDSRKKAHNILAAAGRRGIVKLIHVAADFCYGEIKAHKKPIATVCFSPTQETHLFSKSASESLLLVVLWKSQGFLNKGSCHQGKQGHRNKRQEQALGREHCYSPVAAISSRNILFQAEPGPLAEVQQLLFLP